MERRIDTMSEAIYTVYWLRDQLELLGQAERLPAISAGRMLSEVDALADYCNAARMAGATYVRPPDSPCKPSDYEPIPYHPVLRRRAERAAYSSAGDA